MGSRQLLRTESPVSFWSWYLVVLFSVVMISNIDSAASGRVGSNRIVIAMFLNALGLVAALKLGGVL